MTRGDLRIINQGAGRRPFRVAASVTRGYAGEPIAHWATYGSGLAVTVTGVCSANTVGVMVDGGPIVASSVSGELVGIAAADMKVNSSSAVTAQTLYVDVPIPNLTEIRGNAKTKTSMDTDAEMLLLLWDSLLFDLTSNVYTIEEAGSADTSGLIFMNGNPAKGTLDVVVDMRAFYRADVS